ncbi:MAG: hypothetical protein GY797_02690 [Deltaproteobacteria bacterium]|nr:hypothetical protein [Deltaproteobacteria bacterium]
MKIEITKLVVLLPLFGVIIGAVLQHWLSKSAKARESLAQQRVQAYIDFISASAELARLEKESDKRPDVLAKRGSAKYRIVIYGSKDVVEKLAAFESSDKVSEKDKLRYRFLDLCEAMRKDSGSKPLDDMKIIERSIYGAKPVGDLRSDA